MLKEVIDASSKKKVIKIPQKISYKAMISSKSLDSFFNNEVVEEEVEE